METGKIDKDRGLHYAFFEAAKTGQAELLDVLLRAGVNVREQQDLALRLAAEFGQTEMVRVLLEHGADVHAKGGEPLLNATEHNHKATAALIMQWMKKKRDPSPPTV